MQLEADLASVRPHRFHADVFREGPELGVGSRGEVFKDAVEVADPVGGQVCGGGQCGFFILEHQGPDGL